MRSRSLLCAIAAVAVATATLTPATPAHAGTYPVNKCVSDKLKAASSKCKAALGAWSKFVAAGDVAKRDAALAKAAEKMTATWGKAETKAAAKGVDCVDTTLTDAATQALIDAAVGSIVTDVSTGLTGADAKCGSALVKAAGDQCAAFLKNEAGYIGKLAAGKGKRDAGNTKAQDKFTSKVTDLLTSCPSTTATLASIDGAVDGLTSDVITNSIISPNVDDTQFTTISPLENPSPDVVYEGSELHPVCSFGTPYHYFVKKGTVNKLVMYYQGGGACWDYNTCVFIGTFDKDVNPSGSDNPNNTTTGFGDLTNPNNPFKDWNIVFVSYCTGDIHFGDSLPSYSGNTIRHKGWHNARTAEKWAREHFVAPDEIFVTGSSAGAYGAFFNAPLHEEVWPSAQFSVLGDAGNGIITPSFLQNEFNTWNFTAHLPTNIPGVAESISDGTGIPAYTQAVATYYPDTLWAHYSSSYDGGTGGQTGFYNVMSNLHPLVLVEWANWWHKSCAWNPIMVSQAHATAAALPANYRYYIGTGSRHTMYGSNKVYTDTTGGVPLIADWVSAMLNRTPAWTNVECSPGSCETLLPGDPQPGTLPDPPFSQVGPDVVISCP